MLFDGLTAKQATLLRHLGKVRPIKKGDRLFREGDPAYGLFEVLSGTVEIVRDTPQGRRVFTTLGAGSIIGEIGIFYPELGRSAEARAATDVMVFEIPRANPVDVFKEAGDPDAVVRFTENLMCSLADMLRRADAPDAPKALPSKPVLAWAEMNVDEPLSAVESQLPTGLFAKLFAEKKLKPGEYLCREGDAAKELYYIRKGYLMALKKDADGSERELGAISSPAIAGELGFFTEEPRTASLKAGNPVEYTVLGRSEYAKLRKEDPESAVKLITAVAQLTVNLILRREAGL